MKIACVLLPIALAFPSQAQVYQVGPAASAKPETKAKPGTKASQTQSPNPPLGFGSNIENTRLARAAELALQRGDHGLAVDYAQRAAQAAPNDPRLWFLLGYAARLDGKFQLSIASYSRGLHLNPQAPEGLSGLAQAYSMIGRTSDAEQLLKRVIASDPKRRNDVLLLGDLYMRSGDYPNALDWLGRAERMQPDARSELLLALSNQHLKRMDQANHYLQLAKQRAPNNPDVQRSLAGYYREIGNYPEAIAALKSIRSPRPDVVSELAYTYQLDGKLNDAARLYTQAAHALPQDLSAQLSAARAEVAVDAMGPANAFLKRAAALDPDFYRLHAIRGEIAKLEEHDRDAVREYTAALAHLPATPAEGPLYGIQIHMDLMTLYRSLGDEDAARQQLAIARSEIAALNEQGQGRAPFLRLRALIEMSAGRLDSALNDMKEALAIDPHDPNNLQLNGDVLLKLGRTGDAIAAYKQVLAIDPHNRFALTSLGYASRTAGNDADAEKYFERLARDYPSLYVPYLALGDMYTARREFKRAEASYSKGYKVAPGNALIVAGGANAAIEAHNLDLAGTWLSRAAGAMRRQPRVLRENERYLSFRGEYEQSAEAGREAIKVLPQDRDVVVYLGYDLLHLGKYNELLDLTSKYDQILPQEPDIPLLAGYVRKHDGQVELALEDFTEALARDPNLVTAYVNRGYILNDLHRPAAAAADFAAALKREPKNGEAHLGLAYASLDLDRPEAAVRESQLVEQEMGDSKYIHLIRATAYGRQSRLTKAAAEYRAALKFDPNDGTLYLGLGSTLFSQRRYHQALAELETAKKFSPGDANVYALLARAYAYLGDREQTLRNVQLAELHARQTPAGADRARPGESELSEIYVSTGEALSTLGDQNAAMERFEKALAAPNGNRVSVRFAIAQLMALRDQSADAQRQIALALMEAEAGETPPPSGSQFIQAADVFRQMHEYQLSQSYLARAKAAGASDLTVRIGLANNYLALGDTARAKAELAAAGHISDSESDYRYLLAEAGVYQQEHQGAQALTAFAQAAGAAGEDQSAEQELLQAGANEGYRVNPTLSLLGNFSVQPYFEDTTVYVLDSKLDGPVPVPPADIALLPPPRSSLVSQGTVAYHLHLGKWPTPSGFFQITNSRGVISVPATSSIVSRDTTDYVFNGGINPTLHLGRNSLTLNSGIQGTIQRDSRSPVQMNENLFRVFTYVSTTSFFNAISASGYVIRETGPFTEANINLQSLAGAVDFRVGAPWGKTALVTGWGASDQKFSPVGIENYYTSSYVGLTRRFSDRVNIEALAEDLRAWRIVGVHSGIAQALRPAGTFSFSPTRQWNIQASAAYSSTRSFHVYDDIQSGVSVTYIRGFGRKFNDQTGEVRLQYPISFSAGVQDEAFFNFTHGQNQQLKPYVSITLF